MASSRKKNPGARGDWKPWRDGILQADFGASGLKGAAFRQLLFAGQRQMLVRYPNFDSQNPSGGGWAYAEGEMWPMDVDQPDEKKPTLKVRNFDLRRWARPQDVEVFVFPRGRVTRRGRSTQPPSAPSETRLSAIFTGTTASR